MKKLTVSKQEKELQTLRTARRSMTYVVRTLLLVIAGVIVCLAAFLTSERMSNLYILASEGMALRAEYIIADGAYTDLQEYFTLSYLDSDDRLDDSTYDNYTVTSINYDLDIEKVSVLPWSVQATVTALETISLKGTINTDMLSEGEKSSDYPIPVWQTVRYKIHFVNNNSRWFIQEVETVETNPTLSDVRTPDPNLSPRPMATPTPTPELTPTMSPAA